RRPRACSAPPSRCRRASSTPRTAASSGSRALAEVSYLTQSGTVAADETAALESLRSVAPAAASVQRAAIAVQARLEHTAHSSKQWLARASRAYTSWVRFYSAYPREVRQWLDARQIHLGHAAKSFALRDTPAMLARRAKGLPSNKEKPQNRLTLHEDVDKKRPGFPKMKIGKFGSNVSNKQSSMHTASEFDSGLPPLEPAKKKKKTK
ncbi:probable ATP-dependent RNA helicase CG8611, partial [Ostrinia nubilalis]|uniref:probable ATP-dependent RNA helicase CG8611 n=1 Tax=Ostrinia nubilalis TaxID=29057 RepID=UPI003082299C